MKHLAIALLAAATMACLSNTASAQVRFCGGSLMVWDGPRSRWTTDGSGGSDRAIAEYAVTFRNEEPNGLRANVTVELINSMVRDYTVENIAQPFTVNFRGLTYVSLMRLNLRIGREHPGSLSVDVFAAYRFTCTFTRP